MIDYIIAQERSGMNIYEIAKLCGVAPSTVSKVINNYHGVSEATKEKVLGVIEKQNFTSNINARQLSKKTSSLVGILLPTSEQVNTDSYFFARIILGFRKKAASMGYDVVFVSRNIFSRKVSYLDHCKYMNIGGVLVVAYNKDDANVLEVIDSDIPVVSTYYRGNQKVTEIYSNDYAGTQSAIEHFIELGHKNIGYICGSFDTLSAKTRLQAFQDTLEMHNISSSDKWIKYAKYYNYEEGYRVMSDWIQLGEPLPTAIGVASDTIAYGAIKALKDHNVRVPDDISIIGFDDHEASRFVSPELTTIKQNLERIGSIAADTLIRKIQGENFTEPITVPVSIIERNSCKKL